MAAKIKINTCFQYFAALDHQLDWGARLVPGHHDQLSIIAGHALQIVQADMLIGAMDHFDIIHGEHDRLESVHIGRDLGHAAAICASNHEGRGNGCTGRGGAGRGGDQFPAL